MHDVMGRTPALDLSGVPDDASEGRGWRGSTFFHVASGPGCRRWELIWNFPHCHRVVRSAFDRQQLIWIIGNHSHYFPQGAYDNLSTIGEVPNYRAFVTCGGT